MRGTSVATILILTLTATAAGCGRTVPGGTPWRDLPMEKQPEVVGDEEIMARAEAVQPIVERDYTLGLESERATAEPDLFADSHAGQTISYADQGVGVSQAREISLGMTADDVISVLGVPETRRLRQRTPPTVEWVYPDWVRLYTSESSGSAYHKSKLKVIIRDGRVIGWHQL